MSYIPDTRVDEDYNEKYLNTKDKNFLTGYDLAVDDAINLFYNIECFPEFEELLEDNKAIIREGKMHVAIKAMTDWMKSRRNELVVSFIESMDEKEYRAIKEKIDGRSEKEN